ncbi:site-specific integrase [Paenibacillus albilobatus]|uniref:Site-specific integrase n=1 Tax=Paenibacillus albilobatus TaxID=2716884 RepID=A0A919XLS1_9BACL|nr:site-specific integrase [Paenibacillus albilobatus]GIO33758.1 site-specific integrase [Paenibacillus albilobatus]
MAVYKDEKAKKNPWYFVFYTGEIKNGVRERIKRRGFKTKKAAEAAEAETRTSLNKGDYFEPSKTLFKDYIAEWLKNRRNLSPETVELYENNLRLYINPSLGHIPLSKLNAQHIEDFLTTMEEKGLGEWSIKRAFSILNAALNSAVTKDLILKNPANKVEKPKVTRKSMQVWEPVFTFDFLAKTKGKSRYWIAIYLAIMTGMRQGEILGLRWSDIDFENKSLHIQQTVTKRRRIKDGAKTPSSIRSVALSTDTIEKLKEHRSIILQERLFYGEEYQNNDLVVCTATGGPATARNIYRAWERFLEKHKAPHITFHDLRHTHVAMMIKQGVHMKVISERLGHSSISVTMDIYGHLLPNMQSDAAEQMDKLNPKLTTTKG